MNYFELFQLPVTLRPDPMQVKQQFYALSRQYHPDFFAQANEDEQAHALEKASLVNKAFKVLQSPEATIQYVLMEKGLLQEEEKYQLPPTFLMEMMDLNEQASDAAIDGDEAQMASIRAQIDQFETEIYAPVKQIMADYQEGVTTEKELLQVKAYYYKKKYLNRILAGLK
jgi:molecular chaperone HscB